MKIRRPAFSYYGGKWRLAAKYPTPRHSTIVEPFAGAAGYSLRHHHHDAVLVDKSEVIAGIWDYLISATPDEILSLPIIHPGQHVDDLKVCAAARSLIGFWIGHGLPRPRKRPSTWHESRPSYRNKTWCPNTRAHMARVSEAVSHWRIICGDYTDAPDVEATWFIDPPYEDKGRYYPCGSEGIDYIHLGQWCRGLQGQVMVCENVGAEWLPFEPFAEARSTWAPGREHGKRTSHEAAWFNETSPYRQQDLLGGMAE